MNRLLKWIKTRLFSVRSITFFQLIKKVTGVVSVFENKHKFHGYFCFIAPLEYFEMPKWLSTKVLVLGWGQTVHTQTHTEFVLGLAPLLARWQYGSITNEGHRSFANSLSPLADSTKSSFLPRSYDSGELIISQESQKHRHTLIKCDSGHN